MLDLGRRGKIKVYNVKGNQLDSNLLGKYLSDIYEAKSPWRAEWFDNKLRKSGEKYFVESNHDNNMSPQSQKHLSSCTLMKDEISRISLEDWLMSNHYKDFQLRVLKKEIYLFGNLGKVSRGSMSIRIGHTSIVTGLLLTGILISE